MDLQFFADEGSGGEKTEKATTKKRQDARKKGQVMKSAELTTAVVLLAAFVALNAFQGLSTESVTLFANKLFSQYAMANPELTLPVIYSLFGEAAIAYALCVGPVLALVYVAAFVSNVAQVGFAFSTEPLAFKPDRVNPINGFKRMFSGKNLVNLVKSVLKVAIVGMVAYVYIVDKLPEITLLLSLAPVAAARAGFSMVFGLAYRILAAILILAAFDYGYQWWQFEKDLRMTKQEVKEEYKQMEGDPKVKSKIREKQRSISMQRMMQNVPKADVVITNPTHFAVAIRYDQAVSDAPVVVAKGQDYLAFRIRDIAKEHGVAIVENKPLARALYDGVEVDQKIPVELYQAVAEVLAFVYRLQNRVVA